MDLSGLDLNGVDLHGADLASTKLCGTQLQGANLQACDLNTADYAWADLSNANLRNADLLNATFFEATWDGADITDTCLDYRAALADGGALQSWMRNACCTHREAFFNALGMSSTSLVMEYRVWEIFGGDIVIREYRTPADSWERKSGTPSPYPFVGYNAFSPPHRYAGLSDCSRPHLQDKQLLSDMANLCRALRAGVLTIEVLSEQTRALLPSVRP